MCTVTLSYNEKDKANPTLYVDSVPLPEDKEYYTPEELRSLLISDINEIYGVKNAI